MCHACPRSNITILPLINILIFDVVSARSYNTINDQHGTPDAFDTTIGATLTLKNTM